MTPGHNHAVFSRCCFEAEGSEHLDDALNPIGFFVHGVRGPVQTPTRPEREESGKGRKQVIGVAQIDVHRLAGGLHCTKVPGSRPFEAEV